MQILVFKPLSANIKIYFSLSVVLRIKASFCRPIYHYHYRYRYYRHHCYHYYYSLFLPFVSPLCHFKFQRILMVNNIFFFYSRLENRVLLLTEKAASRLLLSLSSLSLLLLLLLSLFSFIIFLSFVSSLSPFQVSTKFNGHCITLMRITMNNTKPYALQLRLYLKYIARIECWPIF